MGNFKSKLSSSGGGSTGSQKKGEITEADRAILNLKTQRRKLNDQRTRLEKLTEREREIVKELLGKKLKQRALLTLKKVKQQEGQIDQIDTYLMRVEEMLVNMETTKETAKLFETLRMGADALKAAQSQLSLEEVEQLAEDTAEAKEYEQRLTQLMGESWTGELDSEVMEELESLERVVFGEELPEVPTKQLTPEEGATLPTVPDHALEPADVLRAQARAAGGKLRAEPVPAE